MIRYLIIDDESMAHTIIKGYCDLLPNMSLMKNCYDALEALEYLNEHSVDLIFLDLNMPKLKGFDFLRTLPVPPKVIVTTAYAEFALEGYELNVVDYLLKPFSFARFLQAVNKAVSSSAKSPVLAKEQKEGGTRSIFLHSNKTYTQVFFDQIQFIEAAGNYSKVVTTEETITVREKIPDLLSSFDDQDFMQVHKSFAVAKKYIKKIEGNRILIGEHRIPIGKIYKMNITNLLK